MPSSHTAENVEKSQTDARRWEKNIFWVYEIFFANIWGTLESQKKHFICQFRTLTNTVDVNIKSGVLFSIWIPSWVPLFNKRTRNEIFKYSRTGKVLSKVRSCLPIFSWCLETWQKAADSVPTPRTALHISGAQRRDHKTLFSPFAERILAYDIIFTTQIRW